MATLDVKTVLKQIDPTLRRDLLGDLPGLDGLDWDQVKKKHQVDPLLENLQAVSPEEKRKVHQLLRTFVSLKGSSGLKVLHEEMLEQAPELVPAWGERKSRMDKVVWTYLNAKSVFEEAIIFAKADELSQKRVWHKWPGVDCGEFHATDERIAELKRLLIEHHSDELRGDTCEVHHYSRRNGAEYFFAYLPDWPDNFLVFSRSGELKALDLPTAFSILFVFTPGTGVLEVIAAGSESTLLSLRRRFYEAMTQTQVEDIDLERPAFELDHLLADGFSFSGHDTTRIERVDLTRLQMFPKVEGHDLEGLQPRLRRGMSWPRIHEMLDKMLMTDDLDRTQVTMDEARIRIQCVGDGQRRGRVLTIRVTPRGCDLKSVDDEDLRVLGEACLKAWRIDRD